MVLGMSMAVWENVCMYGTGDEHGCMGECMYVWYLNQHGCMGECMYVWYWG